MAHDYHEALPGYDRDQMLHDGCGECEQRAASADHGIAQLDHQNFARAWARAAQWYKTGLPNGSDAEIPMLVVLWAVQVQLARYGHPIGTLPVRARTSAAGERS